MFNETREKARGLLTAEAIIAGFLFASTAIQWQAIQEFWITGPVPASTFLTTVLNYCLIIITVRCIWICLRALDRCDRDWYLVSYRIFVVVLLGTILFNVLPSMISVYRIEFTSTPRSLLVLPFEGQTAVIALVVTAPLVLFAFFYPKPASELLSRLWEYKPLLGIGIICFILGLSAIALGYPTIYNPDGSIPQQLSLLLGFEFHQKYGSYLTHAGYFSLLIGLVALVLPLTCGKEPYQISPKCMSCQSG